MPKKNIKKVVKKVEKDVVSFEKEFMSRLTTLVISAFGLVAALAWNSAIQEWFKQQELLSSYGPWMYALFVTILAVIVTLYVSKLSKKIQEK